MKLSEDELLKRIAETEEKLKDARKRLPAHTVRPHQLQEIEELEDELLELKRELKNRDQGD